MIAGSKALKTLSLKRGSVFKMELGPKDGVTPKNKEDVSRTKYFIVMGVDNGRVMVCSVLINSQINPKLFNIIGEYQHLINSSDYKFLNGKDRYIDCTKLIELQYNRVLDNAEYIGIVSEDLIKEIIDLLHKSPFIKPRVIREYNL